MKNHLNRQSFLLAMLFSCLLVMAVHSSSIAQEEGGKEKIAVMNLKAERGLDEGLVKLLNELLMTEFEKTGKYKVFGGSDIESILKMEEKKQMMDCDDVGCLSELGGALGVEKLAFANIGKIGNYYLVNVKIINVKKAVVEGRVSYKVSGIEDKLIRAITASVEKLVTGKSPPDMQESGDEVSASGMATVKLEEEMDPYSLWGHISFWSGVGVTAFGGVAMALSAVAGSDYADGDLAAEGRSHTWATVMYTGFGIGTAMIATGVVLWLLEPGYSDTSIGTMASACPTHDGSGVVFSLRWGW